VYSNQPGCCLVTRTKNSTSLSPRLKQRVAQASLRAESPHRRRLSNSIAASLLKGCYDAWADEQRAYYHEQYLHMLEAMVIAAQKAQEWPRSLYLAQQILGEDSYREDIYCLVMRAHAAQANRFAVKEQFETLRSLLKKELDVEPAAETIKIYRQLLA
jgi:DNA-binding SARP family transcriptional activator